METKIIPSTNEKPIDIHYEKLSEKEFVNEYYRRQKNYFEARIVFKNMMRSPEFKDKETVADIAERYGYYKAQYCEYKCRNVEFNIKDCHFNPYPKSKELWKLKL